MTDKEYFAIDYHKALMNNPKLFSVQAQRYISELLAKQNNLKIQFPEEVYLKPYDKNVLTILSEHRDVWIVGEYIYDQIGIEQELSKEKIARSLDRLKNGGYINENPEMPRSFQITAKGLKMLNKLVYDY